MPPYIRRRLLKHRRPGRFHPRRDQRLPEIEHVRAAEPAAVRPSRPSWIKPIDRQQRRAEDEHDDLDGVVVSHGAHAAEHGVKAGQRDDQDGADPEAVDAQAQQVEVHLRQQGAEHHAAGENAHGDLGDDEGDQETTEST